MRSAQKGSDKPIASGNARKKPSSSFFAFINLQKESPVWRVGIEATPGLDTRATALVRRRLRLLAFPPLLYLSAVFVFDDFLNHLWNAGLVLVHLAF
jgi:hypothetical protein